MRNKTPFYRIVLLMAALLVASCGTTTNITGMWQDPNYEPGSIKKILIVGMSSHHGRRSAFEYNMKQRFVDAGLDAVATLDVVTHEEKLSRETFQKYFADMNIDAVLVSRLVSVDTETSYTPGHVYTVRRAYYHDFYGYYGIAYGHVYSPGYLTTTKIIQAETNLYDTSSGRLVWSGISETIDPKDALDAIESFSRVMVGTLHKEGYLARSK